MQLNSKFSDSTFAYIVKDWCQLMILNISENLCSSIIGDWTPPEKILSHSVAVKDSNLKYVDG
jgi:hypothetical protein